MKNQRISSSKYSYVLLILTISFLSILPKANAQCGMNISTSITNETCYNGTNGAVNVTVSGGTAPYLYQLAEAGAGAWSSTHNFTGLAAGSYPISVKDNTGCIKTIYINITQPANFSTSYTASDITCLGGTNGSISTVTTGGTAPYSYNWTMNGTPFSTAANISNLLPGNYILVVTDAAGCTTAPIITQQIKSIGLTGFNEDVVANGNNVSPASSSSNAFDDGNGNILYASGYTNASGVAESPGGLPVGGNFASTQNATRIFQLAAYNTNNSLLLRSSGANTYGGASTGTLSFLSQYRSPYSTLYVLASTGSGTGMLNYTLNFADGSTAAGSLTFADWYLAGSNPQSAIKLKRIARSNGVYDTRYDFNLFELPITVAGANQSKVLNSISFSWTNAGAARVNVMAITGYTTTISGIRINDGTSTTVTPTVSISSNAASNTFCTGQSITFTATPVNGGSSPNYQWKKNGSNFGSNAPTCTYSLLNNNDVISVVMTSNLACVSSPSATSNTLTMINGTAVASVAVLASSSNICNGNMVNFTATPTNGGTTPGYQWKLNNINVGSNLATYSNSSLNNNDQVKVVMTSNIACATSNPATSGTVVMTVSPTTTPTVSITANPVNPVAGSPVTFTATVTNAGASPGYQWYKNGVEISGASASTLYVALPLSGESYSVKLSSSYPCSSTPMLMSNYISINSVLPVTIEWFHAKPDNGKALLQWKTAQENNNRQFIIERASSSNSTSFTKVGVVPANNFPIGSIYNFMNDPGQNGIYLYRLTQEDIDGVKKSLGIRSVNLNGKNSWLIQDLGSSWQLSCNQSFTYRLLDVQGRALIVSSGNGVASIAKPQPAGIYLLQFETGGSLFTQRLLK